MYLKEDKICYQMVY